MTQTEQIILEEGTLNNTSWNTVKKIIQSGINTVGDLARQTPHQLSTMSGVGEDTCEKYIGIALDMIDDNIITGAQLLDKIRNRHKLTTGSRAVDEILRSKDDIKYGRPGGIEEGTITEVSGSNGSGKTQLMHRLAVNTQLPTDLGGLDGKVMWLDSEDTFRPDRIIEICESCGYDDGDYLEGILYKRTLSSVHQQKIISALPRVCQEDDVRLVIVDSMMAHLRAEYVGRGMLAARQHVLGDMLQKLVKLASNHGIAVIYTNQVMDKPTPYGNPTEAIGGHVMGHASSLRLFIRKGRKGIRVMKVMKSPYLPEREAPFLLTDKGVEDTPDQAKRFREIDEEEEERDS